MNCLPNVSIALSLISLTAGVWFLYKTQKENLSILFKVAAWFVIIVALLNLACCGLRCCMYGCRMKKECRMEMMYGGNCNMGMNNCGMGMGKGMCMMGGGGMCGMNQMCPMMSGSGGNCCGMCKGGSCDKGGMKCDDDDDDNGCPEMKKGDGKCDMKMMKKDSVVKKK
ncbi:MAG: hypothetical protein HY063_04465 [Bacteroidetes bacterium]|nr:hypothetical protein [Bacteroidota bacterium]